MKSILNKQVLVEIKKIKKADILIGIPSLNNEKTISYVVETVKNGLNKHFSDYKSVVVNSDCGSIDKTREVFKSCFLREKKIDFISSVFKEKPGKGKALRRIFEIGKALDIKVCVVVDSDLRSITPEWIKLLAGSVLKGKYDYAAPLYVRYKYDGTITNFIVHPLMRSLYGKIIRQPIGGEFGFSKKLLDKYLSFKNIWQTDVAFYGIDAWMTTLALTNSPKVCQVFLGAKIHDPKDPAASLGPMFKQVVGTIFNLAYDNQKVWLKIKTPKKIKTLGEISKVSPEEVKVNLDNLINKFKEGFNSYQKIYKEILEEDNFKVLETLSKSNQKRFSFPSSVWIKIIYDYLAFYKKLRKNKKDKKINLILESLIPIYFGFVGSFVKKTKRDSLKVAENKIQKIAKEFEKQKPYLISRWSEI